VSEIISQEKLRRLVGEWISAGKRVYGPRRPKPGPVLYAWLKAADELLLDGYVRPANSIKEVVFPRHEVLYSYRLEGKKISMGEPEPLSAERIVVGARPCDAASLTILDHVFNWDYKDSFYNRRRELTTVITVACSRHDAHCFCTSVGLAPDAVLAGYLAGVVERFRESPLDSMTGPVARRDRASVEANLAALAGEPRLTALYQAFLSSAWPDFEKDGGDSA